LKKKHGLQFPFTQFIAIIVITISLFLVIDFGRRTAASYQIKDEAARLEKEVTAAHAYRAALEARLNYVQSDAYVEEVARTRLKWAREGETVVVVMATPQAAPQSPSGDRPPSTNGIVPRSPWQAWWLLFFGALPPM
jgi:cell division protein FtsB